MKLLILGSSGLLGNTITKYFLGKKNYKTYGSLSDLSKINLFKGNYFNNFVIMKNFLDLIALEEHINKLKPNVIINCLGITNKKKSDNLIEEYIEINSLFPHKLYNICCKNKIRLIHLSSDCVFSGNKGFYNEDDIPDPVDFYGRSKLLGELNFANTLTIRKSVIGHELETRKGLLEWFLNKKDKVEGYKKVIFSGLTVLELAIIIDTYILPNKDLKGIYHISGYPISKFDLLKIIADIYRKRIQIVPNELQNIDRSLNSSSFNTLTGYKMKSWPELIKAMYEFNLSNK